MKKEPIITRKLFWGTLSIVGVLILFVAIIAMTGHCSKKTDVERALTNSLKVKKGNPSSLKILDISEPDSVFFNRMGPDFEIMGLSEKFLQYSMNIMQESETDMLLNGNQAYRCKMERYSATSNALNELNAMLEKPAGRHCGWRVKAKYQTIDEAGTPYVAETWFIFDKRKKHILNSFEFCIL